MKRTILIIGLVLLLVVSSGCLPTPQEEVTPTEEVRPDEVPEDVGEKPTETAEPETTVAPTPEAPPKPTTEAETSTDSETLRNLIFEHDKLFRETKAAYDRGARPRSTVDKDGHLVTSWTYHPNGALDKIENKRDDGHGWTTTAFRNRDPLITVHGRVGGDALRDAYEEIKRGDYDFTTNPVDVAFIRLFVGEAKEMNTSTLQGMLANPTVSTNDLAVMVGEGRHVGMGPALVIGYTDTADPNDGNSIYACVIQRYGSGIPTKAYYFDDPTA